MLGTLLIIPIVYNLLNKGNKYVFICLLLLRYFLDCLDGSVARKCKKYSRFGALFDILSDFLVYVILNCIMIYNIVYYRNLNIQNILILILLIFGNISFIYDTIREILNKWSSINAYHTFAVNKFTHDNGILFWILLSLFYKLYYI